LKPIIVDLGCGPNKTAGALGFDRLAQPGVNVVCDMERPLPIRTGSVDGIHMSHIIEHVRELIPFMEEVYRVCRAGAEVRVVAPYYTSRGAFRDPTHVRFITEDTFQYFEPPTDYGVKTNFRIERIEYEYRKPFRFFPRYLQKRCRRHFWNVVDNLIVTLRAVKA
jgi:SAM-dependent methyltransferase